MGVSRFHSGALKRHLLFFAATLSMLAFLPSCKKGKSSSKALLLAQLSFISGRKKCSQRPPRVFTWLSLWPQLSHMNTPSCYQRIKGLPRCAYTNPDLSPWLVTLPTEQNQVSVNKSAMACGQPTVPAMCLCSFHALPPITSSHLLYLNSPCSCLYL
jgi:hypothetical protein